MLRRFLILLSLVTSMITSPAVATEYSCDEAGFDLAVAAGGGPHAFDCVGSTTIVF